MSALREHYQGKLDKALHVSSPLSRASIIDGILDRMRRDRRVPHLLLCAFLQDNAKIIKEIQNARLTPNAAAIV